MKNTIAITVCYETPDLIEKAVNSVKYHYPNLEVYIIDGSRLGSKCYHTVDQLAESHRKIRVRHLMRNIGHGKGLQYGILSSDAENILIFDSDIELLKPCIAEMKELLTGDVFGCGKIYTVCQNGHVNNGGNIPYLHPYFAMFRRSVYEQLSPLRNHGAPMIELCKSLVDSQYSIVPLPHIEKKVRHEWKGTRTIHPKWFKEL